MAPPKYLMRILSQPTGVDEATWQKWYVQEHVPDVVNNGVAVRGALFRAFNDFTLQTKTPADGSGETKLHDAELSHFNESPTDKTFCAVYQTNFENYTQTEEIKKVPLTTDMFGGKEFFPMAQWDARVYELIQNYDPDNLGESKLHAFNDCALYYNH